MDILSQYKDTLHKLKDRYYTLFMEPYSKRDHKRIELLEDEIRDMEYAITLMTKRDHCRGYSPLSSGLVRCGSFYFDLM